MHRKRIDAAGARILVTAGTCGQLQFKNGERKNPLNSQNYVDLPAVLVSQLLCHAMRLSLMLHKKMANLFYRKGKPEAFATLGIISRAHGAAGKYRRRQLEMT